MTAKHRPAVWTALTPKQICDVILYRIENVKLNEVDIGTYASMIMYHMNRKDFDYTNLDNKFHLADNHQV